MKEHPEYIVATLILLALLVGLVVWVVIKIFSWLGSALRGLAGPNLAECTEVNLGKEWGQPTGQIVGESHYQDNLRQIAGPKTKDEKLFSCKAFLVRDPGNKYDENAVAVMINGLQVGHLSRPDAKAVRAAFDEMAARKEVPVCPARIVGGWKDDAGEGFYGVQLFCELPRGKRRKKRAA